jgi:hypothetical protein
MRNAYEILNKTIEPQLVNESYFNQLIGDFKRSYLDSQNYEERLSVHRYPNELKDEILHDLNDRIQKMHQRDEMKDNYGNTAGYVSSTINNIWKSDKRLKSLFNATKKYCEIRSRDFNVIAVHVAEYRALNKLFFNIQKSMRIYKPVKIKPTQTMVDTNKTNVFISYSWDSPEHQAWVVGLADIINSHGGNAIVDRRLKFGGHLRLFMEHNIKAADVVLMILSPNYKEKAEGLKGGVGYEYNIITKQLFNTIHTNEKYIGVLRDGDHVSSVPDFIEDFKYVDLRPGKDYDIHLQDLLAQILKAPLKQPDETNKTKPFMENDYADLKSLVSEMKKKAFDYFQKIFEGENEMMVKLKVVTRLPEWENEIKEYNQAVVAKFNPQKMIIAEDYLTDFKKNVFGKVLWTVSSAIKPIPNPDLARYKEDFREADPQDIYTTVNTILNAAHAYVKDVTPTIPYRSISEVADLHMEYLNEQGMFMNRIIGYGIRSELLHRYYPANFAVMTQKSLWAMYFICDSLKEFITIEQKNRKGIMRVSHNWQYPYERFNFIMNELAKDLEKWFAVYNIKLKPEYRFGYVNMFLATIHKINKPDIDLLHEWVEMK